MWTRKGDLKGGWCDPSRAQLYSYTEPFRLESIANNLVASTLRNGLKTFIPMAYFASRYADSTLKPVESADSSAIILDGAGGIKVKSRSFTEIPLSQIDMNDFNSISRGLPRAVRQHFIPKGASAPGHKLALAIADMFQAMFDMVRDRSDFELGFDIYKIYVDRAYRQWFTFPNDNVRVDLFHSGLYQESLLSWQTLKVGGISSYPVTWESTYSGGWISSYLVPGNPTYSVDVGYLAKPVLPGNPTNSGYPITSLLWMSHGCPMGLPCQDPDTWVIPDWDIQLFHLGYPGDLTPS
ncbi:hypothetical protein BT96DRAFT_1104493 [Gymnopus androsaceus JB14]|uniref:Uncharacterized protein n=1 Tax=Gymnopus androsaceus JB14 TaxID=1447944 RepID=A0A6A4HNY3_9AGAR|nr:hypothetical protein BT96DRAFT_1104493 [Gymnopus androsaceus JB14]